MNELKGVTDEEFDLIINKALDHYVDQVASYQGPAAGVWLDNTVRTAHIAKYPGGCRPTWGQMCEECCTRLGGVEP